MNGAYATLEMERCVSRSHGFDSHPVCPDRSGEDLDRRFSGRSGRCDRHECGAELCVVVFGMRHTRRSVGRHSALLHSADAKAGAGVARLGSVVGVRCRMCFRTLVRLLAFSASGPSDDRRRTESRCPGGEVAVGGCARRRPLRTAVRGRETVGYRNRRCCVAVSCAAADSFGTRSEGCGTETTPVPAGPVSAGTGVVESEASDGSASCAAGGRRIQNSEVKWNRIFLKFSCASASP